MSLTAARYKHIFVADQQISLSTGTTMHMIELVLATQTYGWSAEELHCQYSYSLSWADLLGPCLLLGLQNNYGC